MRRLRAAMVGVALLGLGVVFAGAPAQVEEVEQVEQVEEVAGRAGAAPSPIDAPADACVDAELRVRPKELHREAEDGNAKEGMRRRAGPLASTEESGGGLRTNDPLATDLIAGEDVQQDAPLEELLRVSD